MYLSDRLVGVLVAALSVAVLTAALRVPAVPGLTHGPSLLPTLIGFGMVGTALTMNISAWSKPRSERAIDARDWAGNTRSIITAMWSILGALAAVVLLRKLGFQAAIGTYLFILLILLRMGTLKAAIVAAVVTLATFYVFRTGLGVPIPSSFELTW